MSNINKIIEEHIENTTDKGELWSYITPTIKEFTTEIAKQSIITLLDTLIEEKKGMKKETINVCSDEDYKNGRMCNNCESMVSDCEKELCRRTYNECLDEDITNLTNIKNNIK